MNYYGGDPVERPPDHVLQLTDRVGDEITIGLMMVSGFPDPPPEPDRTDLDPLVLARALYFQGAGLRSLGRLPEARSAAERSNEMYREAGDLGSATSALNVIGAVLSQQGDPEAGMEARVHGA